MKATSRKKLAVRKETIRRLQDWSLRLAAGGKADHPRVVTIVGCTVSCHLCTVAEITGPIPGPPAPQ
jgi:hypothetical protein